ncbi:MAG: hypothetical protein JXR76_17030 [Deltaproteobacteria bacterium]|nr:hypothetical protein [Deltaproteobacteria bacterium]
MTDKTVWRLFFYVLWATVACTEEFIVNDVGNRDDTETKDTHSPPVDTNNNPRGCDLNTADGAPVNTKVDLVLAVDNSAGMEAETVMVHTELPILFSNLTQQGIDMHVILIAASTPADDGKIKNGICLEAPMGSGQCPDDTNLPKYLHIEQNIGSKDALTVFEKTRDTWRPAIRPDSQVHLMVVSDDDANMDAASFMSQMDALTPPLNTFYFHAIGASVDKAIACASNPPLACCETAAKEGIAYKDLAQQTDGLFYDLCEQNFASAFEELDSFIMQRVCGEDMLPEAPISE